MVKNNRSNKRVTRRNFDEDIMEEGGAVISVKKESG
jgi:hypothetical protein